MSPLHRILSVCTAAAGLFCTAQAVPKPPRLYEIPIVRFSVDGLGNRWIERGRLDSLGRFEGDSIAPVLESVVVPDAVLFRNVISVDAWLAYGNLGPGAVDNFVIDEVAGPFNVGQRPYQFISVSASPKLDLGDAVNMSTRGHVAPGGELLIGGFVIENQHRLVLIRGIGPTLARYGVTDPVADPYIVIYKNGSNQFQFFNDDWGQRFDADEIERVVERVGAFPLDRGSKDAAYLIELAPGAYTVHVGTDGAAGTGLFEVYVVP